MMGPVIPGQWPILPPDLPIRTQPDFLDTEEVGDSSPPSHSSVIAGTSWPGQRIRPLAATSSSAKLVPMALNSQIDDKTSPASIFFASRFPNLKTARDWALPQLVDARNHTIQPPEIIRHTKPWLLGRIGTAFDYRVRYYLAVTSPDEFTARTGGSLLLMVAPPAQRALWMTHIHEF